MTQRKAPSKVKPRRVGRPTLFTKTAREEFVKAVSLGAVIPLAAGAAGWSDGTAWKFLARGELAERMEDAGEPIPVAERPFLEFRREVKKAQSTCAQGAMASVIRASTRGTWQAGAWIMERLYPEHYAKRTEVFLSGAGGGPIEVDVNREEVKALVLRHIGQLPPAAEIVDVPPANGQNGLPSGRNGHPQ